MPNPNRTAGSKQALGKRGENLAADHLAKQGYLLVGANWHCAYGEIDLIAQHGDTLVFVEVRTRHSGLEAAFESISARKRQNLERLAHLYLSESDLDADTIWRIDVIAISFSPQGAPVVEHVQDALDW